MAARTIEGHHDGHGLNEDIVIQSDDRDPNGGNSAHVYDLFMVEDPNAVPVQIGFIQFQHGPRGVKGSKAGATEAAILAILIDRLEGFQAGPYACGENTAQLLHLRIALALTKQRADERAARGVLGKNKR